MSRKKIFVGRVTVTGKREIFKVDANGTKLYPIFPSHIYINYTFTIGPFKTIEAAKLCVEDDDCSSLSVAKTYEKRLAIRKNQSELIAGYKAHLDK